MLTTAMRLAQSRLIRPMCLAAMASLPRPFLRGLPMLSAHPQSAAIPDVDLLSDGLLTIRQAAAFLQVGRASVYRMMEAGNLRFVCLPGQRSRRIPKRALIEFASRGLSGVE